MNTKKNLKLLLIKIIWSLISQILKIMFKYKKKYKLHFKVMMSWEDEYFNCSQKQWPIEKCEWQMNE